MMGRLACVATAIIAAMALAGCSGSGRSSSDTGQDSVSPGSGSTFAACALSSCYLSVSQSPPIHGDPALMDGVRFVVSSSKHIGDVSANRRILVWENTDFGPHGGQEILAFDRSKGRMYVVSAAPDSVQERLVVNDEDHLDPRLLFTKGPIGSDGVNANVMTMEEWDAETNTSRELPVPGIPKVYPIERWGAWVMCSQKQDWYSDNVFLFNVETTEVVHPPAPENLRLATNAEANVSLNYHLHGGDFIWAQAKQPMSGKPVSGPTTFWAYNLTTRTTKLSISSDLPVLDFEPEDDASTLVAPAGQSHANSFFFLRAHQSAENITDPAHWVSSFGLHGDWVLYAQHDIGDYTKADQVMRNRLTGETRLVGRQPDWYLGPRDGTGESEFYVATNSQLYAQKTYKILEILIPTS